MSRIAKTFARLKAEGRTAFMPYVTMGYPELDSTVSLVLAILESGGDMVELGVPFSDPIADGPTIQRSTFRALQNGITLKKCFETAHALRSRTDAPMLFMGYYNPVFAYGVERYAAECAANGVDGLILPDVPPEEALEVQAACQKVGLDFPAFVSPTSTDERIERAAKTATGFIYCVSLTGVTGARATLPDYLPEFIGRVRAKTDLPLALGFGISKPEHFQAASKLVDGVAVGAALVDVLEKARADERVTQASAFVKHVTGRS